MHVVFRDPQQGGSIQQGQVHKKNQQQFQNKGLRTTLVKRSRFKKLLDAVVEVSACVFAASVKLFQVKEWLNHLNSQRGIFRCCVDYKRLQDLDFLFEPRKSVNRSTDSRLR